jgi:hypothetical protein
MADPPTALESNDDAGVRAGHEPKRSTRRRIVVLGIVVVKLAVVAIILILPSGLAISLGAVHGVALLVLLASAAVTLVVLKLRGGAMRPELSHRLRYQHGPVPAWGRRKVSGILKNREDR